MSILNYNGRKLNLKEWPWNNQPSKRHVWKVVKMSIKAGAIERCQRCGSTFIEYADTRGAIYCYATSAWLKDHPEDDGKEG